MEKDRLTGEQIKDIISNLIKWAVTSRYGEFSELVAPKTDTAIDKILSIFKGYKSPEQVKEMLSEVKGKISELSKKLDDREADLINAKTEERERIIKKLAERMPYCPAAVCKGITCEACWRDYLKEG